MNKRAVTSFVLFFSLVAIVPSGILLEVTESEPFGPTRHILASIHGAAAILLVVSALLHLVFNWKAMLSYLKSKATARLRLRGEAVVALVIVAVLIGVAVLHVFILD